VRNFTEPVLLELPDSLVDTRLIETDASGFMGKRIEIAKFMYLLTVLVGWL
jgi:hypothetical protein